MKKIFLTLTFSATLSLGLIGAATELRTNAKNSAPAILAAAPDMPPPVCWPDCDVPSSVR
jgi:hypothetical protein